jgi:DNA invertase Pin-like site-specific DNA recombinase
MKTVLYCRVSTADQTIAHQRSQAETAGFQIDEVIADDGVSGVSTRLRDRPEGRRLFDVLRDGDVLVVRWLDRLGRNYLDVTDVIREFIRRGVIVKTVINAMVFDGATKDPMQMAIRDALIAFMAASAQAQAEATKEAQRAGIAHAKANDDGTKFRGRKPTFTFDKFAQVQQMLSRHCEGDWPETANDLSHQAKSRGPSCGNRRMVSRRGGLNDDGKRRDSPQENFACATAKSRTAAFTYRFGTDASAAEHQRFSRARNTAARNAAWANHAGKRLGHVVCTTRPWKIVAGAVHGRRGRDWRSPYEVGSADAAPCASRRW